MLTYLHASVAVSYLQGAQLTGEREGHEVMVWVADLALWLDGKDVASMIFPGSQD